MSNGNGGMALPPGAALVDPGTMKLPPGATLVDPGGAATQPTATEKAHLFIPGVGYTQMHVPAGIAKHYGAGYMHGLRQGAGLAAVTGVAGGGMAVTPAATSAVGTAIMGSAARAGQMFDQLENTIGDEPVDISKVGDVALEARDGGTPEELE